MTATRMILLATLTAIWIAAAALLWRSEAPDGVATPSLSAAQVFGHDTVSDAARYGRFLRWDLAGSAAAQLAALVLLVRVRRRLAARLRGSAVVRAATVAALVFVVLWVARLPFALAAQWWRRRHDVSRLDYLSFVAGGWTTLAGELALAALAGAAVVALSRRLGARWWLAGWAAIVGVLAAWTLLTPALTPRLQPLRDRALAAEIRALAREQGLESVDVGVQKVRTRTRSINAEGVGAGPTAKVILWDTLLQADVPRAEIRFVAAHELAHVARHHVWKGVGWFALLALPCAWLVSRMTRLDDAGEIPVAALAAALLALALLPAANAISRRYEREADWIALRTTGDPRAAEGLFVRFARTNLADPAPPLAWHLVLGTHPTLLERVELSRAAALRAGPGSP